MVDKKNIDDRAWNSSQNQLTANKYFPKDRMSGSVAWMFLYAVTFINLGTISSTWKDTLSNGDALDATRVPSGQESLRIIQVLTQVMWQQGEDE
jgi:hypothetical protein